MKGIVSGASGPATDGAATVSVDAPDARVPVTGAVPVSEPVPAAEPDPVVAAAAQTDRKGVLGTVSAYWQLTKPRIVLLLLITTFATVLGAGLSGVVTVYPLLSTLLAVFAHRSDGPRAALAVYRGLLVGLFALMAFATTLAVVLTHLPLGGAHVLAIALTLTIQLASLRAIRN